MPGLDVNDQVRTHDAEPDTARPWVLREQLGRTGNQDGCGVAQCGACTVHIDGMATRSGGRRACRWRRGNAGRAALQPVARRIRPTGGGR